MPTETAPAPTKLEPRADDDLSWLRKHSPHEWIQIALGELRRATTWAPAWRPASARQGWR